jgi:hypothetical protein
LAGNVSYITSGSTHHPRDRINITTRGGHFGSKPRSPTHRCVAH